MMKVLKVILLVIGLAISCCSESAPEEYLPGQYFGMAWNAVTNGHSINTEPPLPPGLYKINEPMKDLLKECMERKDLPNFLKILSWLRDDADGVVDKAVAGKGEESVKAEDAYPKTDAIIWFILNVRTLDLDGFKTLLPLLMASAEHVPKAMLVFFVEQLLKHRNWRMLFEAMSYPSLREAAQSSRRAFHSARNWRAIKALYAVAPGALEAVNEKGETALVEAARSESSTFVTARQYYLTIVPQTCVDRECIAALVLCGAETEGIHNHARWEMWGVIRRYGRARFQRNQEIAMLEMGARQADCWLSQLPAELIDKIREILWAAPFLALDHVDWATLKPSTSSE